MPRRPFSVSDIARYRVLSDPQLSPDGSRLAYVVGRFDEADGDRLVTSVWVAPADGSGAGRPFSRGTADRSPRWSPDGRWLAYAGDRGTVGPGKGRPQLQLAPLDGGEPREVTAHPHGVAAPAWSPDGTRLAYTAQVGEGPAKDDAPAAERNAGRRVTHLRQRFDALGIRDDRRSHVFVLDVAAATAPEGTRPEPRQVTDGDWDDEAPAWTPDGTTLVFTSDRRPQRHDEVLRGDVWRVPARGGRARRVTAGTGGASAPKVSPDGTSVAYVGDTAGGDFWWQSQRLLVVPLDGSAPPREVADSVVLLPAGAAFAWHPSGDLVVTRADRGAVGLFRVRPDGGSEGAPDAAALQALLGGDRTLLGPTLSADGGRLAVLTRWYDDPPEVVAADLDAGGLGALLPLTHANAALRDTVTLAQAERVTSTAPDGTETESFLVLPPGGRRGRGERRAGRAAVPLVLHVHGGPHGWNPSPSAVVWLWEQAFAAAGYAVLAPNPRGSAGYGETFQAGCVGDWGGGDFTDLMAAVDAVVARGDADPARLHVFGYSYGGFMTAWTVGHTDRFASGASSAPVIEQVSMLLTTDIPGFSAAEVGALPWSDRDAYTRQSPLTYADQVHTPLRLSCNETDYRTPIAQAEQMFAALTLLGRETELVRYPGGFHGGLSPSQLAAETTSLVAWFDAHGGPDRPSPPGPATSSALTEPAGS